MTFSKVWIYKRWNRGIEVDVQENIKRGTAEMLILALLVEQDRYGYQICQEMAKRSDGTVILQEGSVYPIL